MSTGEPAGQFNTAAVPVGDPPWSDGVEALRPLTIQFRVVGERMWSFRGTVVLTSVGSTTTVTGTFDAATTYGYNGDGTRTSVTDSGVTTQETWDSSGSLPLLISETTGSAASTSSTVQEGPAGAGRAHRCSILPLPERSRLHDRSSRCHRQHLGRPQLRLVRQRDRHRRQLPYALGLRRGGERSAVWAYVPKGSSLRPEHG